MPQDMRVQIPHRAFKYPKTGDRSSRHSTTPAFVRILKDMTILACLLVTLLLILINGFFVLSEFSLVKVRVTRLQELAQSGNAKARRAKQIVEKIESFLATTQLGITMASLGIGWIGEPAMAELVGKLLPNLNPGASSVISHAAAFTLAFLIITSLHITIGELVPKYIAIKRPDRAAMAISAPLVMFYHLTYYPMKALNSTARFLMRLMGLESSGKENVHSEEELKMLLGQSQEQGRLSLGRLLMFENLFDFEHSFVKEIMTPRDAVICLYENAPWSETREIIAKRKFSRYPLCREGIDDSASYIFTKDLNLGPENQPDVKAKARQLLTFGEDSPLSVVLREMQDRRIHMALVKNPDGRVSGIVTTEDIIEEIVGEIRDENEAVPQVLLSRLLVPEAFIMDLSPVDRFVAMDALVANLHSARPVFDRDAAWSSVEKRERMLTCAMGHGAAFPHARLASITQPLVVFARCPEGLDFPSLDHLPVSVMFLILTPQADPTQQLRILSELAKLVTNPPLLKKLQNAKSPSDVVEIVKVFERRVPLQ